MKQEVLQAVGVRLIEERATLGFSQRALAELVGKSRQQIINYETARSEMTVGFLAILHELGFDVQYIITGVRSDDFYAPANDPTLCGEECQAKPSKSESI